MSDRKMWIDIIKIQNNASFKGIDYKKRKLPGGKRSGVVYQFYAPKGVAQRIRSTGATTLC